MVYIEKSNLQILVLVTEMYYQKLWTNIIKELQIWTQTTKIGHLITEKLRCISDWPKLAIPYIIRINQGSGI